MAVINLPDDAEGILRAYGMAEEAAPAAQVEAEPKPTLFPGTFSFVNERKAQVQTLREPCEVDGVVWKELTWRKINAGQAEELQNILEQTQRIEAVYSALTGAPAILFVEMDADDRAEAVETAVNFMPAYIREAFSAINAE